MEKSKSTKNSPNLDSLVLLFSILICLIIGLIIYGFMPKDNEFRCGTETMQPFCGTVSPIDYLSDSFKLEYGKGKKLFNKNCASCHAKNMTSDATGPALAGTEERWADYPRADLYAYIRNSQLLLDNKHPRAVELWEKWGPTFMNAFPDLTDAEIEEILVYIYHH